MIDVVEKWRSVIDKITYKPWARFEIESEYRIQDQMLHIVITTYRRNRKDTDEIIPIITEGHFHLDPKIKDIEIAKILLDLFTGCEIHECEEYFSFDGELIGEPHRGEK